MGIHFYVAKIEGKINYRIEELESNNGEYLIESSFWE